MMDVGAAAASWTLILAGTFFLVTGAVGILRLPDVFARMHAAGMTDTMGAGLVLAGLCFQVEVGPATLRLLLVILFLWFTSPVATHALARAILHDRVRESPAGDGATPAAEGGRLEGRRPDGGVGRRGGAAPAPALDADGGGAPSRP